MLSPLNVDGVWRKWLWSLQKEFHTWPSCVRKKKWENRHLINTKRNKNIITSMHKEINDRCNIPLTVRYPVLSCTCAYISFHLSQIQTSSIRIKITFACALTKWWKAVLRTTASTTSTETLSRLLLIGKHRQHRSCAFVHSIWCRTQKTRINFLHNFAQLFLFTFWCLCFINNI